MFEIEFIGIGRFLVDEIDEIDESRLSFVKSFIAAGTVSIVFYVQVYFRFSSPTGSTMLQIISKTLKL